MGRTTQEQVGHHGRRRLWAAVASATLGLSLLGTASPAAAEPNSPPIPVPDTAEALSGATVVLQPLANDSDPDQDPLSLVSAAVADPASGSVVVAGDEITLTVAPSFAGPLLGTYVVSDGTLAAEGSFTVQVTRPNAPPVAEGDSASVRTGGSVRVDPLANDSDPDGDPLTLTRVQVTTPAAGSAALDGQIVVIRAASGFVGTLVAEYRIVDGRGGSADGQITVAVRKPPNRRPIAVRDAFSAVAGRAYRFRVLANDSDPDGHRIRLDRVRKVTQTSLVKARRDRARVWFRADSSFSGRVKIRYRIRDSRGARDWGVLRVRVRPPAPPVTNSSVERALARLRLPVGYADGRYDAGTRRAVCAWRTITGRTAHRGLPTRAESRAIVRLARLPRARSVMVDGVTISLTCQAAFWVGPDRSYRRVMKVSTGMAGYETRLGTFRVFRYFETWRYSTIYPEARMYKPMQFSGGQAMHGSATDLLVKDYPASHGCVRMLHRDVDALQAGGFGLGSLVRVIGRW